MTESTWAGTHVFAAERIVPATSVEEVQERVATSSGKVRALGTRHSFHDIADSAGTLVSVVDVPFEAELDEGSGEVSVTAGTRYGVLARWLEERGRALHNMGSLPHISIAGATQTGTHGSGNGNGILSTAVRGLEYVDATGALRRVRAGDEGFEGLVVGLGAFGVVTRVSLATQPSFQVRQDVYRGLPWEALLEDLDAVTSAAYSVSVFTDWVEGEVAQVWRKSLVDGSPEPPELWLGAHRDPREEGELVGNSEGLTVQGGVPGPWALRLPHFRLDRTPSNGDEIQTEYFVDRAAGSEALRAVRALAADIAPHLYITELRTAAADRLWLSGAYERDVLGIHFTWRNEPVAVRALLPRVEAALAPFDARPHWGKWHGYDAERIARVTPRLADARDLYESLDPEGRFSNAHLERLGVRVAR